MQNDDKDFDNLRKETALRVEQAGYSSNHFSFERIGDADHPAIVIEYTPTKTRRIYAINGKIDALKGAWAVHFLDELKAGLFHDADACAQQYANTQAELLRQQSEYSLALWKTTNDNAIAKWQEHREAHRRVFFAMVDEGRAYGKGYLKAITILNAGSVIALLTFSHNVFAKGNSCPQVVTMLRDSSFFLYGLGFALLAMGIGYWSNIYYSHTYRRKRKKWLPPLFWIGGDLFGVLAFVLFFVGAYWARENIPALVSCFTPPSAVMP